MAAASWSDDVVFTHNDSGDLARFFAVDALTGAIRATYRVRGATNVDWEDMARGLAVDGTTVLWLADIGDNRVRRSSVVVYEVAEPGPLTGATVPIRARWTLTYPDGPQDAETLLVDPETGRAVIVTKDGGGGVSRAYRVPPTGSGVLERLAELDVRGLPGGGLATPAWSVTGGATSAETGALVLRSYLAAWVWAAPPGGTLAAAWARPPERLDLPLGRQSEAVSFTRDSTGLWLTSEGPDAPLHRVPLTQERSSPPGPGPEPGPGRPPAPVTDRDGGSDRPGTPAMAVITMVAVLGALVVAGAHRRRRRA